MSTVTRRQYLLSKTIGNGRSSISTAIKAVSSTAIEHPEWDMDEERTWDEWDHAETDRRQG